MCVCECVRVWMRASVCACVCARACLRDAARVASRREKERNAGFLSDHRRITERGTTVLLDAAPFSAHQSCARARASNSNKRQENPFNFRPPGSARISVPGSPTDIAPT